MGVLFGGTCYVRNYRSGMGLRGNTSWTPVQPIVDALNNAFYLSFGNVVPTGKRILLAIDTSGSMHGSVVNGIPNMNLHVACGAMAMVTAKVEQQYHIIGVDTRVQELPISPSHRLDIKKTSILLDERSFACSGSDILFLHCLLCQFAQRMGDTRGLYQVVNRFVVWS
jgi:hypothetical protein